MIPLQAWAFPASIGFAAALAAAIAIVATKRWHGRLSFDTAEGPQKFHRAPTPRIGGLAVLAGFCAATLAAPAPVRELLVWLGLSALCAFAAGLREDLTKRTSTSLRLLATVAAALLFHLLTGYTVPRLEVPILDELMAIDVVAIAFTVFAIAGLSNAVNMIDGFNGLAAGAAILMLAAFAVVAHSVGDRQLLAVALVLIAVLTAFLLVNFPSGLMFLGDGGAYFVGLLLAYVAVMLPARNPQVSVWLSVVVLAYPLIEVFFSMFRKAVRRGHRPSRPDGVHLHMLVYRSFARRVASRLGDDRLANPAASVLLWLAPATGLAAVLLVPATREWMLAVLAIQVALYFAVYRRVTLRQRCRWMRGHRGARPRRLPASRT